MDKVELMVGHTLHSRGHGLTVPRPVTVLPGGGYLVGSKQYATKRSLLIDLTGHHEARHWTFDRYFRQGRYAQTMIPTGADSPIMALFGGLTVAVASHPTLGSRITTGTLAANVLTVPTAHGTQRSKAPLPSLGVDLRNRSHEVAKLLFAGFGRKIYAMGYDPDDVLQEVYKGLLIRNAGTCPWDAKKSSFGHYVHMVAGCILSNYHRRESRRRALEQIGLNASTEEGDVINTDVAQACASRLSSATYQDHTEIGNADYLNYLTQRFPPDGIPSKVGPVWEVLPHVLADEGRHAISMALNIPLGHVTRAIHSIREATRQWVMSGFIDPVVPVIP